MRPIPYVRPFMVLAMVATIVSAFGLAPVQNTYAGSHKIVFTSDFNSLATGVLAVGTPVEVAVGSVVASAATVEVAATTESRGKAIVVSGAGAADLRFSTYPSTLPQVGNNRRYDLVVRARLTAPVATVAGSSLFLATIDGARYEIVSFGADGTLAREGVSLGLAYTPESPVEVDVRLDFKNGRMALNLSTAVNSVALARIAIPGNFSPDNIGALIIAAGGASGRYSIDDVEVRVEQEKKKADPARVEFERPEYEVENDHGTAIVSLVLRLNSSRGMATNVFLTLNLDETQLDMLDLSFLSGIGYIKERGHNQIVIGIGENNRFRQEHFQIKIKFKVQAHGNDEHRFDLRYRLNYNDSDGHHEMAPAPIIVIVPVIVSSAPTTPATSVPTDTLPISVTLPLQRLPITHIDVRFRTNWDRDGGLRIYGLPLTEPFSTTNGISVQYFERARFEYHPENAGSPYVILLGRLGVELGQVQPPVAPPTSTLDLAWYFAPTGHTITPRLRNYWRNQSGLATFGYPIGEASTDSTGTVVQYFERARLEYHPEYANTENEVLIGLLGAERLEQLVGSR